MKIVIVILVVVAIVFAVGAGAGLMKPRTSAPSDPGKESRTRERTGFEKFFDHHPIPSGGSNPLKKSVYRAGDPKETVGKAEKIRKVKLRITHSEGCHIPVTYEGNDPKFPKLNTQDTNLPRLPSEGSDDHKEETTIVLLTTSGTLQFGACKTHSGSCPARIEVAK